MKKYTTVIKHEHKQGKSPVFYVIMTPFPFYENMLNFQADLVLIKMGLYWPNFSLVFLIHLFLYAGVYCTATYQKLWRELPSTPPLYHGGGISLRVCPRDNTK